MEFPDLGKNCCEKTCNKLDFLPMKCDACKNVYCGDHFQYVRHGCEIGVLKDVQVPVCPLCAAPVPGRRGDPPDIVVSAHIDNDCQTDAAKQRRNKVFTNRCSNKGCKGKEMVPLICSDCLLNFCFKHRHAQDHQCQGKLGAKRRRAAEAAMVRAKATEESNRAKSQNGQAPVAGGIGSFISNLFTDVQGQLSEDEALARALSLSMQSNQPSANNPEHIRTQSEANRQRVGGDQSTSRCNVS